MIISESYAISHETTKHYTQFAAGNCLVFIIKMVATSAKIESLYNLY